MTWPAVLFWALILVGLISARPLLLYLFFASAAFGTLAVVPTDLTAGVTILPQPVAALALCLWGLRRRGAIEAFGAAAMDPRKLGMLTLFAIYCAASAYILPRVFAGQADVFPLRSDLASAAPLAPSPSNLTQSLYILLSWLTAVIFCVLWRDRRLRVSALRAILAGGAAIVASGLADLAAAGTDVLAPFRTASYVLMVNDSILDAKRVVGLMSEASSFGGLSLVFAALIYFLRDALVVAGAPRAVVVALALALAGMAALSTSSTALVGLALLAGLALSHQLHQALMRRGQMPRGDFYAHAGVVFVGLLVLICLALFDRGALQSAASFIDALILQKPLSSSFAERTEWTRVALQALRDTGGWGVGIGSARTSNYFAAVLSNGGIAGFALLFAFLLQTFARRAAPGDEAAREMTTGLKFVLVLIFAMAALAGTTPDFGLNAAFILGGVIALSAARVKKQRYAPAEMTGQAWARGSE